MSNIIYTYNKTEHSQYTNTTINYVSLNIFYFNISHTYNIYIHNIIRIGTEAISLFNSSPYTQKKITIVMARFQLRMLCRDVIRKESKVFHSHINKFILQKTYTVA